MHLQSPPMTYHANYMINTLIRFFNDPFDRQVIIRSSTIDRLLLISYAVFVIMMFSSVNYQVVYGFFLYIVAPVSLLPINFYHSRELTSFYTVARCKFSFSNTLSTLNCCRSSVFILVSMYMVFILFSSSILPVFSIEWAGVLVKYYISIIIFLLVTSRLVVTNENFTFKICLMLVLPGWLNISVNLYSQYGSLRALSDIYFYRFSPTYGFIPDHYPTTSALLISLLAVASQYLIKYYEHNNIRYIFISMSFTFLIALLLTQSRSCLLGVLFALILKTILEKKYTLQKKHLVYILSFITFTCVYYENITSIIFIRTTSQRIDIWKRFFSLFLERPVFGYGERIQFLVELPHEEMLIGHAHNVILASFVRGGFGAGLIFIISIIRAFNYGYQFLVLYENSFPIILFVTVLVPSLFDFEILIFLPNWQWVCYWLPIGILIGAEMLVKKMVNKSSVYYS